MGDDDAAENTTQRQLLLKHEPTGEKSVPNQRNPRFISRDKSKSSRAISCLRYFWLRYAVCRRALRLGFQTALPFRNGGARTQRRVTETRALKKPSFEIERFQILFDAVNEVGEILGHFDDLSIGKSI